MIDIQVLGPTVVQDGGTRFTGADLGGGKPRQLLEMLALSLGSPVSKDELAERLWDGRPPASHVATLEGYICLLRRRVTAFAGRRGALGTAHHGYVLDAEAVRVDVVDARRLLGGGLVEVSAALDLVGGELLAAAPYASWANAERETFDELCAGACVRAAGQGNAGGEPGLAVRLAREAMRRSYCNEPALRELMRGLMALGARVQALQAYDTLRMAELVDLGVEPARETQDVYLACLRADAPVGGCDHEEAHTLLQLLRRALEADPGALRGVASMVELGQMMIARAG